MRRVEAEALVGRVTLGPSLDHWRPSVRVVSTGPPLRLEVSVVARDAGDGVERVYRAPVSVAGDTTAAEVGRAVLAALLRRMTHEVREGVLVDGVPVDDPHGRPACR